MDAAVVLRRGRFDGSTLEDMRGMLAGVGGSERRLVVHFHGGLVNRERGLAIAERLAPIYQSAGGHPLFVIWQSGLMDTLTGNLRRIAEESIFKRLLARIIQFTLGKASGRDGTRTIGIDAPTLREVSRQLSSAEGGEPYAYLEDERFSALSAAQEAQVEGELLLDQVIQVETERLLRGIGPTPGGEGTERGAETAQATATQATATLISPDVLDDLTSDRVMPGQRSAVMSAKLARATLATLKRVLHRLRTHRGHGVYCTAVEELLRELYLANAGGSLWRGMKQDTEDTFGRDGSRFGGTALLGELAAIGPSSPPLLVGHSTGALYICKLLAHADQVLPPDMRMDVALLAPACDFDAMERVLSRHARRIGRLRIFSMSDERERSDRLVPGVYPRSLLYFVSGALEAQADWPLLGMQRFFALDPPFSAEAFPAIGRVRDELARRRNSCVWSIASGAPGLCSRAIHHGDFDDEPETLQSVAHLIGNS